MTSLTRAKHVSLLATAFMLFAAALIVFPCISSPARPPSPLREFRFQHENILGTSLDLLVIASRESDADACEQALLEEIERLRRILSTYDPASEISRVNRETMPVAGSPELIEVLHGYEYWAEKSQGALNGQLGELIRTWKDAEKQQIEPDASVLSRLASEISQPAWRIDDAAGTVTRLSRQAINVNAIGRGYIMDRAVQAARTQVPSIQGMLLNLGGDLRMHGRGPDAKDDWVIGAADPRRHEDNAPPLAALRLKDGAVATSGPYERYYTFGNKRYSHIFDPRTGQPAEGILSATAAARDSATANALATSLCVLRPEEGLRLVRETPGAECLIVDAEGREFRSPGLERLELPAPRRLANAVALANPWPKDHQAALTLTLISPTNTKKVRRPYVAVWVEDAGGKPVRTLTVWGNKAKYQKDLTYWWKFARDDGALIKAVTRATRSAGRYTLTWDGLDDKGNAVEQGVYTVHVEVHREHGRHVRQKGEIKCGAAPASVTLEKNAEAEESRIEYGPRGK